MRLRSRYWFYVYCWFCGYRARLVTTHLLDCRFVRSHTPGLLHVCYLCVRYLPFFTLPVTWLVHVATRCYHTPHTFCRSHLRLPVYCGYAPYLPLHYRLRYVVAVYAHRLRTPAFCVHTVPVVTTYGWLLPFMPTCLRFTVTWFLFTVCWVTFTPAHIYCVTHTRSFFVYTLRHTTTFDFAVACHTAHVCGYARSCGYHGCGWFWFFSPLSYVYRLVVPFWLLVGSFLRSAAPLRFRLVRFLRSSLVTFSCSGSLRTRTFAFTGCRSHRCGLRGYTCRYTTYMVGWITHHVLHTLPDRTIYHIAVTDTTHTTVYTLPFYGCIVRIGLYILPHACRYVYATYAYVLPLRTVYLTLRSTTRVLYATAARFTRIWILPRSTVVATVTHVLPAVLPVHVWLRFYHLPVPVLGYTHSCVYGSVAVTTVAVLRLYPVPVYRSLHRTRFTRLLHLVHFTLRLPFTVTHMPAPVYLRLPPFTVAVTFTHLPVIPRWFARSFTVRCTVCRRVYCWLFCHRTVLLPRCAYRLLVCVLRFGSATLPCGCCHVRLRLVTCILHTCVYVYLPATHIPGCIHVRAFPVHAHVCAVYHGWFPLHIAVYRLRLRFAVGLLYVCSCYILPYLRCYADYHCVPFPLRVLPAVHVAVAPHCYGCWIRLRLCRLRVYYVWLRTPVGWLPLPLLPAVVPTHTRVYCSRFTFLRTRSTRLRILFAFTDHLPRTVTYVLLRFAVVTVTFACPPRGLDFTRSLRSPFAVGSAAPQVCCSRLPFAVALPLRVTVCSYGCSSSRYAQFTTVDVLQFTCRCGYRLRFGLRICCYVRVTHTFCRLHRFYTLTTRLLLVTPVLVARTLPPFRLRTTTTTFTFTLRLPFCCVPYACLRLLPCVRSVMRFAHTTGCLLRTQHILRITHYAGSLYRSFTHTCHTHTVTPTRLDYRLVLVGSTWFYSSTALPACLPVLYWIRLRCRTRLRTRLCLGLRYYLRCTTFRLPPTVLRYGCGLQLPRYRLPFRSHALRLRFTVVTRYVRIATVTHTHTVHVYTHGCLRYIYAVYGYAYGYWIATVTVIALQFTRSRGCCTAVTVLRCWLHSYVTLSHLRVHCGCVHRGYVVGSLPTVLRITHTRSTTTRLLRVYRLRTHTRGWLYLLPAYVHHPAATPHAVTFWFGLVVAAFTFTVLRLRFTYVAGYVRLRTVLQFTFAVYVTVATFQLLQLVTIYGLFVQLPSVLVLHTTFTTVGCLTFGYAHGYGYGLDYHVHVHGSARLPTHTHTFCVDSATTYRFTGCYTAFPTRLPHTFYHTCIYVALRLHAYAVCVYLAFVITHAPVAVTAWIPCGCIWIRSRFIWLPRLPRCPRFVAAVWVVVVGYAVYIPHTPRYPILVTWFYTVRLRLGYVYWFGYGWLRTVHVLYPVVPLPACLYLPLYPRFWIPAHGAIPLPAVAGYACTHLRHHLVALPFWLVVPALPHTTTLPALACYLRVPVTLYGYTVRLHLPLPLPSDSSPPHTHTPHGCPPPLLRFYTFTVHRAHWIIPLRHICYHVLLVAMRFTRCHCGSGYVRLVRVTCTRSAVTFATAGLPTARSRTLPLYGLQLVGWFFVQFTLYTPVTLCNRLPVYTTYRTLPRTVTARLHSGLRSAVCGYLPHGCGLPYGCGYARLFYRSHYTGYTHHTAHHRTVYVHITRLLHLPRYGSVVRLLPHTVAFYVTGYAAVYHPVLAFLHHFAFLHAIRFTRFLPFTRSGWFYARVRLPVRLPPLHTYTPARLRLRLPHAHAPLPF